MNEELGVQTVSESVISIEQSRAIQEVQASLVIAKKFPRDQDAAYLRIMKACERYSLADKAEYAYPRGDKTVTGPTIKLAETIAQNWGNMNSGVRELSQLGGESEVEAFAWDLETNYKDTKTFTVKHKRYTKAKGNVSLTDPRDIYEYIANNGARRKRACILTIIPGDIVEKAIEQCRATVRKGIKEKPLSDQVRSTLKAFDSLGITKDLIEKRLGHGTDAIIEDELIELNNIGRSIKDNMTSREEWFDIKGAQQQNAADLTDKIKEKPEYKATEIKDDPAQTLKDNLDEGGGPEVIILPDENKSTVDPLTGDDLEQGEPSGILPNGVDATEWLLACRPSVSLKNAQIALKIFEEQESNIAMLEDKKLRARLEEKHRKTIAFIAEKQKAEPSLEKSPERIEFEKKMDSYMAKDEEEKKTRYRDKLNDLGFLSIDDIKQADQEIVLGFLKEEFRE